MRLSPTDLVLIAAEIDPNNQDGFVTEAKKFERQPLPPPEMGIVLDVISTGWTAVNAIVVLRTLLSEANAILAQIKSQNASDIIREVRHALTERYVKPAKQSVDKVQLLINAIVRRIKDKINGPQ
jgi:hypothetical protein